MQSGSRRCQIKKENDIEKFAIQFLLAMDSTLCFFTVSLRMIALAPWKDSMVSIDVRQAAVVAISKCLDNAALVVTTVAVMELC